jgi:hypothetical protein
MAKDSNRSALGFEAALWATADKLRGNLNAAEYKHGSGGAEFSVADATHEPSSQ